MKIPFSKLSLALAAAGLLLLSGSRLFGAQGLSREVWTNIETPPEAQLVDYPAFLGLPLSLTGTPDFYTRADAIDVLGKAVSSAVYAGSSGIRMRGYLIAPDSGDYSFWVTCQDAVAVYMSIDTNPNGKRLIIAHNGPESGQTASSPLTSAPVRLEAGKKYYLEVIQKSEATNGTFVLSWNLPSGRSQVIPESAFETYTPPTTASPGLTREFFPNIPGSSLDEFTSNPAFYRVPAVTTEGSPSSQRGLGQDYGVRLRGYLTAPATGDYTFWECGSGDVSVLLATDDNPHAVHQPLQLNDRPSIRVIASHKGHTAPFEWAKYRDQQSKPVGLIAGRRDRKSVV